MDKLPYRDGLAPVVPEPVVAMTTIETDWRKGLPILAGRGITLRELRISDASSLFALLSTEEVSRFISPPPASVEAFERFIAWTIAEREAGVHFCFGIVPEGLDTAVGIFQVRQMAPEFATAEWGFALGSVYWGNGLFIEGARLVVDFVFDVVRVHRLEARAALQNGRGNGALKKIGAMHEGILRQAFYRDGKYVDQVLWSIVDGDRPHLFARRTFSIH